MVFILEIRIKIEINR